MWILILLALWVIVTNCTTIVGGDDPRDHDYNDRGERYPDSRRRPR